MTNNLEILAKIIEFADNAHDGQMRKYSSERYIVHPVRVMKMCRKYTDSLPVLAAAILHDVIEDTHYTENDLSTFLQNYLNEEQQNHTLQLVIELTDVYVKKNFPALNRLKRKKMELSRLMEITPEAQTIKYADIIDNANEISKNDPDFAKRYLQECYDIISVLTKGNPELRMVALETIVTSEKNIN